MKREEKMKEFIEKTRTLMKEYEITIRGWDTGAVYANHDCKDMRFANSEKSYLLYHPFKPELEY